MRDPASIRHHRLFALVGTPYTLKFLWQPLGRCAARAVLHPRFRPPARLAGVLAIAADRPRSCCWRCGSARSPLFVRSRAAWSRHVVTQDIVVDAFPSESPARERTGRPDMASMSRLSHWHSGFHGGRSCSMLSAFETPASPVPRHGCGAMGDGGIGADRHLTHWPHRAGQSARAEAATRSDSAFARVIHAAVGAFSEFLRSQRRLGGACFRGAVQYSPMRFPAP